jgi:hypothetical protein
MVAPWTVTPQTNRYVFSGYNENNFSLIILYMYFLCRIAKCNVLNIFIFCSILTKRSSEKYTTDMKIKILC